MSSNAKVSAPASSLVLASHIRDGWLLIHRSRNEMVRLTSEEAETILPSDAVIRTLSDRFAVASIELSEVCNVRCVHCYLGEKRPTERLSRDCWFTHVDTIEKTGVIWLQFTGGEPLIFPSFAEIYAHAWDRGFVTTVLTNGILLGQARFLRLFTERPPSRISVSVYGASETSYEAVTRARGSWKRFASSIQAASEAGLPLRLKVVELAENKDEVAAMGAFARRFGEEDSIHEIMPTLRGDLVPLTHRARPIGRSTRWIGCEAGRSSFHVLSNGTAVLCKVARSPSISLDQLQELPLIAETVLREPSVCSVCDLRAGCGICPPLYQLLNASHPNVCRKEVIP